MGRIFDRRAAVARLREEPIEGIFVRLLPYSEAHAADTVALRNTERARFNLNQQQELTLESQDAWYRSVYLPREDDVQWAVLAARSGPGTGARPQTTPVLGRRCTGASAPGQGRFLPGPGDTFLGINALYSIDLDGGESAEKGRLVLREDVSRGAPYALEADYLLCCTAFDVLRLQRLVTCVREENGSMISMNERMGFRYRETRPLRGVPYRYYTCARDELERAYLERILDHWRRRA